MRLALSFLLAGLALCGVSLATDIDREPWHWSGKIPTAILPLKAPPTAREPKAFDHLHIAPQTSMKDLIAKIGAPDAFAPQFCVTRTEGVLVGRVKGGPEAGTFRYALHGGGEVFISVSDFHTIEAVIRFQRREDHHELYRRSASK